jgi:hypothetical protein
VIDPAVASASEAQTDSLVGKWEGELQVEKQRGPKLYSHYGGVVEGIADSLDLRAAPAVRSAQSPVNPTATTKRRTDEDANRRGVVVRHLVLVALALATVTFVTAAICDGETDLSKVLVGRWQGEIGGWRAGTGDRTLIITALTQRDGQWTAHALYAITGHGFVNVDIEVDNSREWPWLRFATTAKPPSIVRLNLLNGTTLVGTFTRPAGGFTQWDYSIRFDKVAE